MVVVPKEAVPVVLVRRLAVALVRRLPAPLRLTSSLSTSNTMLPPSLPVSEAMW